jgi:hypothetical protein
MPDPEMQGRVHLRPFPAKARLGMRTIAMNEKRVGIDAAGREGLTAKAYAEAHG